jgi:hypothetical protein
MGKGHESFVWSWLLIDFKDEFKAYPLETVAAAAVAGSYQTWPQQSSLYASGRSSCCC